MQPSPVLRTAAPAVLAMLLSAASPLTALADHHQPAAPARGVTPTPTPGFAQDPPTSTMPASPAASPMQHGMPHGAHAPMHARHHDVPLDAITVLDAASLQWSDAPSALPKGARLAVLQGDPFAPAPYVVRLKMPPGYTIPPHWHSRAESITVISGVLSIGMGDKVEPATAQTLKAGGYHAIAAGQHHFAFSEGGAMVQIHGEGPFDITYVNPRDNPEATAKPR